MSRATMTRRTFLQATAFTVAGGVIAACAPTAAPATTGGGEYTCPCPFCGYEWYTFRVWPNKEDGRYWCRRCLKSGAGIQYLRDLKEMTNQEACHHLGQEPKAQRLTAPRRQSAGQKQGFWT